MDVKYNELKRIYNDHFTLDYFGTDISNKFALISLTSYLVYKLKSKKPDVTCWSILYQINTQGNLGIPDDVLKGLSIICEDFSYGCTDFPTFGLEDKSIPNKIKELLSNYMPF